MAEALKGNGKAPGNKKSIGKSKAAPAKEKTSVGHNLTEIRKQAKEAFTELEKLQDEMETAMGDFRADFKSLYEKWAEKIGCSRAVMRALFSDFRSEKKRQARMKEMEGTDRENLEMLAAALEGTPFGKYIVENMELISSGKSTPDEPAPAARAAAG